MRGIGQSSGVSRRKQDEQRRRRVHAVGEPEEDGRHGRRPSELLQTETGQCLRVTASVPLWPPHPPTPQSEISMAER